MSYELSSRGFEDRRKKIRNTAERRVTPGNSWVPWSAETLRMIIFVVVVTVMIAWTVRAWIA